ncbi:MAG: carboxypeptidase regulatory-like domain-containing protein, partial [Dehalococcoidia bacterium]
MNATNNWWGTASSAQIQSKIYDWFDDASKSIVTFSPFLSSPDITAPVSPPSGLTATSSASGINLTWNANPESDIAGYKVYYGSTTGFPYQGTGAAQGNSPINVGNVTGFNLTGLTGTQYIAITAYDTDGNESWYSGEMMVMPGTYISGHVYDANTHQPISGVPLMILDAPSFAVIRSTTTDATGSYQFADIPAGSYRLFVFGTDYNFQAYNGKGSASQADTLNLSAGQTFVWDFNLTHGAGSISGTVTDGTNPIANATISAFNAATNQVVFGTISGADGTYTISSLPPGSYKIQATSGVLSEWYHDKGASAQADAVAVASLANTPGINFTLGPQQQQYAADVSSNTSYVYSITGDSFINQDVTGNLGWHAKFNNSGINPVTDVTLTLDTSLTITNAWGSVQPQQTTNPVTWSFGDTQPGGFTYGGINASNTVNFNPGYDITRSIAPVQLNASGQQTLTVTLTPRIPGNFWLNIYANDTDQVISTIVSPVPDGQNGVNLHADGKGVDIPVNNTAVGTPYTVT